MVLTLMRLRRGIDNTAFGNLFGIQPSTVSNFLYRELNFLISWPTKDQVSKGLPKCFKFYPKTWCIIDCTEFFVQKSSLPSSQRITSTCSYKHHITFKSLVGISPTGSFCFYLVYLLVVFLIKEIVEHSGFLNKVEHGDNIIADRGFLIRGDLAKKGATLNISPFSFNKKTFWCCHC